VRALPDRADKGKPEKKVQPKPGDLPPNSSDDDGSSDDGSSDGDAAPPPKRELTRKEREQLEAQRDAIPDPEQVAEDMERLRIMREKRALQAAQRIAKEGGVDRYALPEGAVKETYKSPLPEPKKPAAAAAE